MSRRAPAFVSRRTASALLDLSLSAFDAWVSRGILPPPAPGAPFHERRWEWAQIVAALRGCGWNATGDLFGAKEFSKPAGPRGPKPGHGGRPRKAGCE
jgi:hypothetical protein